MKNLDSCIQEAVSIDPRTVETIVDKFEPRVLTKGEYLLRSGTPCNTLTFIESGYMRMFDLADGKEVTIWIGASGSFITSLSSFIFKTPNYWNIQALTECNIQVISRTDHFALTEQYPKWLEFDNHLLARAFAVLEQNMFAHLHTTAEERLNLLMENNPSLLNHVPLQYIASMLGITPETLSRLRKQRASPNS